MFEYSADKPFLKMESGKSIDILLNVSQVFVYCFVDIDSMAVYFGETFLMGVANKEMNLVWKKHADRMKINVCLNILLTSLFRKRKVENRSTPC